MRDSSIIKTVVGLSLSMDSFLTIFKSFLSYFCWSPSVIAAGQSHLMSLPLYSPTALIQTYLFCKRSFAFLKIVPSIIKWLGPSTINVFIHFVIFTQIGTAACKCKVSYLMCYNFEVKYLTSLVWTPLPNKVHWFFSLYSYSCCFAFSSAYHQWSDIISIINSPTPLTDQWMFTRMHSFWDSISFIFSSLLICDMWYIHFQIMRYYSANPLCPFCCTLEGQQYMCPPIMIHWHGIDNAMNT